ncbi:hypothetical protein [Nostoc sp.]|uniref:hypothetical protein n=1 Tax=Nostoc sp. TaxID=1180 RepID=UPI002FF5428F
MRKIKIDIVGFRDYGVLKKTYFYDLGYSVHLAVIIGVFKLVESKANILQWLR